MKDQDISALRREYVAEGLHRQDLQADPMAQFGLWMEAARQAHPDDATSMALATADASGMPSVRIVLLKRFDERGFAWFTDYESEKGQQLAVNPQAELLFYWRGLERQVRVRGQVTRLSRPEAETYFSERPLGSQLSAAVSRQSAAVESRQLLEVAVEQLRVQSSGAEIECPEHWGGYLLVPQRFEFWQGRESRLHDRFVYQSSSQGGWTLTRLQP